ncbi:MULTISPECIES: single-stranded-DNA-specific exonuclease RecJ [Aerococcus]|uniref:Single-stranded-DNA-specific exonuclease RecJ n=1 Tax=Aerococcus viridans TaxID=1377 RepID=A0A2N6UCW9_9LACT|nr:MULTISPECIES: single-stranded-DNA-specific exonuclease RecJ [Aerococcus]OFU51506.1 single-stranded-DNA-specific exonuclease RecJ [Aerococcus sp. HMSC10H05]PMC79399.1 single-stranded-DNA-specific exonuclease RecJ [Aerococcus viridans]
MLQSVYEWIEPEYLTKEDDQSTAFIQQLAEDLSLPKMVVQVIYDKGYQTTAAIRAFIAKEPIFHDPFLLKDMDKAVSRLQQAVENYEEILIYGDYDADGITSTTILYETLEMLGANVSFYLPNRFEDGYGPNKDVYAYYIKKGTQLILTCDNGVAGHEAVAYAKEQGIDVIITDHHEIGDSLPDAYAIVHPRHPEGQYPFGDLAGAGVALKLATALLGETPSDLLDVAAIGTVADSVSLTDENRVIVSSGIDQMKHTERLGLQMFFEKENIQPDQIDEQTISFILGPRLNALGRLGDPNPGVQFLTSFDDQEVAELVELLDSENNARKAIVDEMVKEAEALVDGENHLPQMIILGQEGWHEGVLGIVASRLVEKYHRPTILLSKNSEKGTYKGSGRSVEGIDLFQVLQAGKDYTDKFGGHEMAAGMTVPIDQFEDWKTTLLDRMIEFASVFNQKTPLRIDGVIDISDITLENIKALDPIKPFGTDNRQPLFLMRDIQLSQIQLIGKDKNTLKLMVTDGDVKISMIAFKSGDLAKQLVANEPIDVVFSLSVNAWNGNQSPQAQIKDIRQASKSIFDLRNLRERNQIMSIENAIYVFENEPFFQAYKDDIPFTSEAIMTSDIGQIIEKGTTLVAYKSLVIFDIPKDLSAIKDLIISKAIDNIYVYAYSSINAYLVGKPTRQEFAQLYKYLQGHGTVPLAGNEQVLADYFKISKVKLELMVKVLEEAELVKWHNTDLVTIPVSEKVDLLATKTMADWASQINNERLLRYNDVTMIKDYFYSGGK